MNNFEPSILKYNEAGLIPVIAQDNNTLEVLMLAWMNLEAVERTLKTGKLTYWSRSRSEFWIKGETSGNTQELVELRFDCDRDALLAIVKQKGPACHTNRKSCFFTGIIDGSEFELMVPVDQNG
ncbi:MAG: phosphoribosyl-AMP cyclohydrolase [Paracoccaceae bacterium]|nr:phosphoribosyl-AMP cyclohydrolase [Rhodobacterales bacterium]